MHRKVSHRLHFAWVPSIGTPKGLLTTLQHETSSFLHSMSNSSTNCKNQQRTFENKWSGAIGVAGVAHGNSRRRLRKRIRRMKPAKEGTECNDYCSKNRGHLGVCLVLPIEGIAGRKLPTIG